jgi:hypothetical protein
VTLTIPRSSCCPYADGRKICGSNIHTCFANRNTDYNANPYPTPVPPTATATVTPSPTVSPTPMPRLAVREPDLHELQTYLASVPVRFFSEIKGTTEYFEGYFDEFPLTESAQIMYEDVNGSGEMDLIVADLQPYIWGRGIGWLFYFGKMDMEIRCC